MSKNSRKQPVAFTKPPEPAFLRRLKEQVGYKEGPNVDTKREALDEATVEDGADREDEKPTVVVLRTGDLSAEEATRIDSNILKDEEGPLDLATKKITFKKPTKRSAEEEASAEIKSKLEKKEASAMASVKNKSLLSFDDEEDDDN